MHLLKRCHPSRLSGSGSSGHPNSLASADLRGRRVSQFAMHNTAWLIERSSGAPRSRPPCARPENGRLVGIECLFGGPQASSSAWVGGGAGAARPVSGRPSSEADRRITTQTGRSSWLCSFVARSGDVRRPLRRFQCVMRTPTQINMRDFAALIAAPTRAAQPRSTPREHARITLREAEHLQPQRQVAIVQHWQPYARRPQHRTGHDEDRTAVVSRLTGAAPTR